MVGYVFGADDYHWALVTQSGVRHLIHKSAAVLVFGRESTYGDEPRHEELEHLVRPFRDWVERTYFAHYQTSDPLQPLPVRDEDRIA